MKDSKISLGCGCWGCLLQLIALLFICMVYSLFIGSGEFYNKSIKNINTILDRDTISISK